MQKTILKRAVVSQEKQRYNVVSRKNGKTLTFLHSKKGFSSVATSEPEQLMVLLACAPFHCTHRKQHRTSTVKSRLQLLICSSHSPYL